MPEAFPGRADRTPYTQELGERICALVADGLSLLEVVDTLGGSPNIRSIINWRRTAPGFGDMYEQAFRDRLEVWSEEIMTVSDDARNDWMDRQLASGAIIRSPDPETAARSRLRLDARKWLLSKLHPERYGELVKLDANVKSQNTHFIDPETLAAIKALLE